MHISTRLINYKKNDYIELYNENYDGSISSLKKEIDSITDYWKIFIKYMEEDILNSKYDFDKLTTWVENLDNFLKVQNYFPTIEHSAALLSMKSFNENLVFPNKTKTTSNILVSHSYQTPDFIGLQSGSGFNFRNNKDFSISEKSVDIKQYKIVRIKSEDENGKVIFLDIKINKLNKKELLMTVLTLPEFWRNFHIVSRKEKGLKSYNHPAYKINKTLSKFYTPAKIFNLNTINGNSKSELYNIIKSERPLALSVNSFAMHLFFVLPGFALPLTESEKIWSSKNEPDLTINLNYNEINLITVKYSNNKDENEELLKEFSQTFSMREQSIAQFFEIGPYSGGQYIITTENEFAFVYETNMIEIFDSISKLDKTYKNS